MDQLCDICGKGFACGKSLWRHMRMSHGKCKAEKEQCHICDKFVNSLEAHVKTHTFKSGSVIKVFNMMNII